MIGLSWERRTPDFKWERVPIEIARDAWAKDQTALRVRVIHEKCQRCRGAGELCPVCGMPADVCTCAADREDHPPVECDHCEGAGVKVGEAATLDKWFEVLAVLIDQWRPELSRSALLTQALLVFRDFTREPDISGAAGLELAEPRPGMEIQPGEPLALDEEGLLRPARAGDTVIGWADRTPYDENHPGQIRYRPVPSATSCPKCGGWNNVPFCSECRRREKASTGV